MSRRLAESVNRRSGWPGEGGGGVDVDICEAAAVLHDLGHPPFGHAGETALRSAVQDVQARWETEEMGGFEGNAQSFRLATKVLSHKGEDRGLQLTHAVLNASLKYPWVSGDPDAPRHDKWGVYPTEQRELAEVRLENAGSYRPVIEAQVMEWADDVVYAVHDLEDWFRAGYMPLARLAVDSYEQARFARFAASRLRAPGVEPDALVERIVGEVLLDPDGPFESFRAALRAGKHVHDADTGDARRAVRGLRASVFDAATTEWELGMRPDPRLDTSTLSFEVDDLVRFRVDVLQQLLWCYVIGDSRVATMQLGQMRLLRELFDRHIAAIEDAEYRVFPGELGRFVESCDPGGRIRAVADYISGLTDQAAYRLHERLRFGGDRLHDFL